MSPEAKYCRSCGAELIWTVTANGKRMPVDIAPREDGNILLTEYPDGLMTAEYVKPTLFEEWDVPAPEPRRHLSHFRTCKQSKEWRCGS